MSHILSFKGYKGKMENTPTMDISLDRKKEIEKKVSKILRNESFQMDSPENSLIVDIVSLVKGNGFEVQSADLDKNITGCIMVNDYDSVLDTNKHKLILVNTHFDNKNNDENVILKKSRFITAHEYGHFILHKQDQIPIYAHRDTSHRTDNIELEADYFARSILMPLDIFRAYVSALKSFKLFDNKKKAIPTLSTIFKVTKDKVQKRLDDLKELENWSAN